MFGETTDTLLTVDSSVSVDRNFFSVARTTPLVAYTDISLIQLKVVVDEVNNIVRKKITPGRHELARYRIESQKFTTLIPSEVAPAATALRAYSIWTSFPLGLKVVRENEYCNPNRKPLILQLIAFSLRG